MCRYAYNRLDLAESGAGHLACASQCLALSCVNSVTHLRCSRLFSLILYGIEHNSSCYFKTLKKETGNQPRQPLHLVAVRRAGPLWSTVLHSLQLGASTTLPEQTELQPAVHCSELALGSHQAMPHFIRGFTVLFWVRMSPTQSETTVLTEVHPAYRCKWMWRGRRCRGEGAVRRPVCCSLPGNPPVLDEL